ncbi:hypothetical protein LCGC14_2927450 [marine sediment metagenome]|uniref:Uncharacterized protein n=1 Tax=marine sediment metagenome TaxID=412755 RepID=A0A0F8Y8S3_9ZZZZ
MVSDKFTTASPIIASYSYTDIAEGTGVVIFKAFITDIGALGHLTASQVYSRNIETSETGTAGDWDTIGDRDFDLAPFNRSQIIKGTAIVNISQHAVTSGSSRFLIRVRKWDGSAETEIANVTTASEGAGDVVMHCEQLTIPRTHFKSGDVLRLTIISQASGSGSQTLYYGTDPQNRDGANIIPSTTPVTTKLEFHCPFEFQNI